MTSAKVVVNANSKSDCCIHQRQSSASFVHNLNRVLFLGVLSGYKPKSVFEVYGIISFMKVTSRMKSVLRTIFQVDLG